MPWTNLRDLQFDEIAVILAAEGEPRFRAKQLCHWLYKRQATSWQQLTDMPEAIRQHLQQGYTLESLELLRHQQSDDGTEKISVWPERRKPSRNRAHSRRGTAHA